MNAKDLVLLHGEKLIGKTILTEAMGVYPGGPATVTEINPDPEAPEIVMQVEHPTWRGDNDGDNDRGQIGIFEYEEVVELETLMKELVLETAKKLVDEAWTKAIEDFHG